MRNLPNPDQSSFFTEPADDDGAKPHGSRAAKGRARRRRSRLILTAACGLPVILLVVSIVGWSSGSSGPGGFTRATAAGPGSASYVQDIPGSHALATPSALAARNTVCPPLLRIPEQHVVDQLVLTPKGETINGVVPDPMSTDVLSSPWPDKGLKASGILQWLFAPAHWAVGTWVAKTADGKCVRGFTTTALSKLRYHMGKGKPDAWMWYVWATLPSGAQLIKLVLDIYDRNPAPAPSLGTA